MTLVSQESVVTERWDALVHLVETAEMGAAKAKRLMKTIELTDDYTEFEAVIEAVERILIGHIEAAMDDVKAYRKDIAGYRREYRERFGNCDALGLDKAG